MKKEKCNTEIGIIELSYETNITVHENIEFYGINVTSKDENGMTENKAIYDITSDKEKIDALIELIFLGKVTPVTLEDIIDDFIE